MNNIVRKTDALLIRAKFGWDEFWNREEGDTNFISILVLLGIALALAGVFLSFQSDIIDWVEKNIGTFFTTDVKGRK